MLRILFACFLYFFINANLWAVDALLTESTILRERPDAADGGAAVEGNQKVEAIRKSKDGNWIFVRTDLASEGWVEKRLLKKYPKSGTNKASGTSRVEVPEINSKVLAYRESRLYEGPNVKTPKEIGEVQPDDELQILAASQDGRWLKVKVTFTGISGWVPTSVATASRGPVLNPRQNVSKADDSGAESKNFAAEESISLSSSKNHDRLYTIGINSHFLVTKVTGSTKNVYDKLLSLSMGKNFGIFEIVPRISWVPGTSTNVISLGAELDYNFTKNKSPEKTIYGLYALPSITKGLGDLIYTAYGLEGGFTSKYFMLRKSSTAIRADILARLQRVSSINTVSIGVSVGIQPYF